MAFFDFIADDLNTQNLDFEDVDTSSPDYGDLDSQIDISNDNGDNLLSDNDWSWLDNYVYFGGNGVSEDANLGIDDDTDVNDHNTQCSNTFETSVYISNQL